MPDASQVIEASRKESQQLRKKIVNEVLLLCLALVTMVFVCFTFHFQYMTTYAGLGLMMLTVTIFTFLRMKLARQLYQLDFSLPPVAIIKDFKSFHKAQRFVNTTAYAGYVILLNIAFALYFYEVIFHAGMHSVWQILAVCIYLAWMLISVFYVTAERTLRENERVKKILSSLKESENILGNN